LKMLHVPNVPAAVILLVLLVTAPVLWMYIRRRHGFPALALTEKRRRAEAKARLAEAGAGAPVEGEAPTSGGQTCARQIWRAPTWTTRDSSKYLTVVTFEPKSTQMCYGRALASIAVLTLRVSARDTRSMNEYVRYLDRLPEHNPCACAGCGMGSTERSPSGYRPASSVCFSLPRGTTRQLQRRMKNVRVMQRAHETAKAGADYANACCRLPERGWSVWRPAG